MRQDVSDTTPANNNHSARKLPREYLKIVMCDFGLTDKNANSKVRWYVWCTTCEHRIIFSALHNRDLDMSL